MTKMKNIKFSVLGSQSGYTIIELTTVMLISGFLLASAAAGFSIFFSKFTELSRWVDLQKSAFETLQTIKSGMLVGTGNDVAFYGVVTSERLEFEASGIGIGSQKLICHQPETSEVYKYNRIEFFFDGSAIKTRYTHGPVNSQLVDLFPKGRQKDIMKVDKFTMSQHNQGSDLKAVKIALSASVQTGKDRFRYVNYSTIMAIR